MLMILQRYNLEVIFVKDKENVVADTLSRTTRRENTTEETKLQDKNILNMTEDNRISYVIQKINITKSL